jgi:tRNA pseudouridine(38-40) synthase
MLSSSSSFTSTMVDDESAGKRKAASEHGDGDGAANTVSNKTASEEALRSSSSRSRRKKKKRRKVIEVNTTRKESWDNGSAPPHPGSYANPQFRAQFGVELPPAQPEEEGNDDDDGASTSKTAKRKVAFLLGYVGTQYAGFQTNEGQRTVQAEFELALLRTGLLDARNFGFPGKYGWSTSGRTDRGVHAAAQVCSAKIELLPGQTVEHVRDLLNACLSEHGTDITVLDVKRTTRSFCAKTQRERVRYQYLIPSFVLTDVATIRKLFDKAGCPDNGRPASDPLSAEEIAKIQPHLKDYRVTPDKLRALRTALKLYEGTHSFHNFTRRLSSDAPQAVRYIVSYTVEEPVLYNGIEWIPTAVLGQSFLLNQIRKMICMAVDVARGAAPMATIEKALQKDQDIRINNAPAQGLFLEMSFYTAYNNRKQQNTDLEDLDWHVEDSPAWKRWKEFRNNTLLKHIAAEEEREGNFVKHLYVQEYIMDYQKYYQLDQEGEDAGSGEANLEQSGHVKL